MRACQRRIADAVATVLPDGYELPWALADLSRLDGWLEKLDARARNVILATFIAARDADDVGRSMGFATSRFGEGAPSRATSTRQRDSLASRLAPARLGRECAWLLALAAT